MKPIDNVTVVAAVVVGNATVVAPKAVSHVKALAAVVEDATVIIKVLTIGR
jgi:hypothetical protein